MAFVLAKILASPFGGICKARLQSVTALFQVNSRLFGGGGGGSKCPFPRGWSKIRKWAFSSSLPLSGETGPRMSPHTTSAFSCRRWCGRGESVPTSNSGPFKKNKAIPASVPFPTRLPSVALSLSSLFFVWACSHWPLVSGYLALPFSL